MTARTPGPSRRPAAVWCSGFRASRRASRRRRPCSPARATRGGTGSGAHPAGMPARRAELPAATRRCSSPATACRRPRTPAASRCSRRRRGSRPPRSTRPREIPRCTRTSVCGGPPDTSTFFSRPGNPFTPKARNRLSGDQNGPGAGAFSSRQRPRVERIERAHPQHRRGHPARAPRTRCDGRPATRRPCSRRSSASGGRIWKRTGAATGGRSRKCTNASAAADATATAATPQAATVSRDVLPADA